MYFCQYNRAKFWHFGLFFEHTLKFWNKQWGLKLKANHEMLIFRASSWGRSVFRHSTRYLIPSAWILIPLNEKNLLREKIIEWNFEEFQENSRKKNNLLKLIWKLLSFGRMNLKNTAKSFTPSLSTSQLQMNLEKLNNFIYPSKSKERCWIFCQ